MNKITIFIYLKLLEDKFKIDIKEYNYSRNLDLEHLNRNGRNWDVTI